MPWSPGVDAFKKHSFIVLAQEFKGAWYPWTFNFWENGENPRQRQPNAHAFCSTSKSTAAPLKDVLKKVVMGRQETPKLIAGRIKIRSRLARRPRGIDLPRRGTRGDTLNVLEAHLDKLETNALIHAAADPAIAINLLRELGAWLNLAKSDSSWVST